MVRVRPKVATLLRKTAHAIQMHCVSQGKWSASDLKYQLHFVKRKTRFKYIVFYKEIVRVRPKVVTSLRKTEHATQMHLMLQGKLPVRPKVAT